MATPKLEDGYTAFEQGDVSKAVAIWTELADLGNATAQLNLGQLYRQGKGVPQNDKQAVNWYIKAAQNNSDIARYTLTLMHHEGRATDEDLTKAGLVLQAPQATTNQLKSEPTSEPEQYPATRGWLEQLSPNAYLIQIVAASKPNSIQDFADKNLPGVSPKPQVVHTLREGKDWYHLVIGPYPSKQAAQQAADTLPKTELANKPWLCTAKSLQKIDGN